MIKSAPRLLIAGTGSGCGKTTAVCSILQALKNRGHDVASYKCGPDYIDPMFHSEIIGAPCTNLDLFFSDENQARAIFARHSRELNVIEGVMGYYDGTAMDSCTASAYHVGQVLHAPAVLVVNVSGMALSAAAVVRGYQSLRTPHGIQGVILNRATAMTYPRLKAVIEKECGVRVYGYLPVCKECALESRHLGLVTAQEVENLQEKLNILAAQAEKCLDLDGLIELMRAQPPLEAEEFSAPFVGNVTVAVAKDEAFCFYYRDNLEMLEAMGAKLVEFSPLRDEKLPDCDGLILGGGYPEVHAKTLSANRAMLDCLKKAIEGGLPTIAECGGFMALTRQIGEYPMAGVIDTACFNTTRLSRFGYAALHADSDSLLLKKGDFVRGHEFHYWDAEDPGSALTARKESGRHWACAHVSDTLYAGYPHLYFPSNPETAKRFIEKCLERKSSHETDGN